MKGLIDHSGLSMVAKIDGKNIVCAINKYEFRYGVAGHLAIMSLLCKQKGVLMISVNERFG